MRTFKIELELVLKNDDTDWLIRAIEDCLESGEFVDSLKINEVIEDGK